ncbi:MAG: hypothetical protein ABI947_12730 [Chloroflexota bacterium]
MSDQSIQDVVTYAGLNVNNLSYLLAEAIRNDSNLEMDWLWLAKHLVVESEKRYCLYRALYINPQSTVAISNLQALSTKQSGSLLQKISSIIATRFAKLNPRQKKHNAANQAS